MSKVVLNMHFYSNLTGLLYCLCSLSPKRDDLVKACTALGVSDTGSTTDLINRLEELLLYKDLYPKMFVKLQKAGGKAKQ